MNKTELITAMAEKSGLTKKDSENALTAFVESIEDALKSGDKVQLVGFGTFEVKARAARKGINPQTMLMYGKEASNRKQEIDRQHYTIPNQRPKDKHCGKI